MNLKKKTHKFIEEALDILFPVRLGVRSYPSTNLKFLELRLLDLLDRNLQPSQIKNEEVALGFIESMPIFKEQLDKDVQAIYKGDPSAKSEDEIILAFPGFQATACYRMAHYLYNNGVSLLPRIFTEYAHSETGVDIHPGAQIGEYFCIDHGTGIVIGETSVIGDWVKIYQGVTLGALSIPDRDCCPNQRHPTIGDHVVIYAQAIILGGDTHIGEHSIIGGNVWLTKSVPPHSRIYFNGAQSVASTNTV